MPGPQWAKLDEWKALAAKGEAPDDAVLLKAYVAEVKAESDARTIDFTISTGTVDRERDVIDPTGWKLTAFKRNPTVLWAHDYSMPPIARATKIRVVDGALKATAEFAPAEVYPFAETIYQLLKGGFLTATSVGFRPLKHSYNADRGGMDFQSQELLEFSVVPVPANPEALMEGKAAGIDLAPLQAWAKAIVDKAPHEQCPMGESCPMRGKAVKDSHASLTDEGVPWVRPSADVRYRHAEIKEYQGYEQYGHTAPNTGATAPSHVHDYSLYVYRDAMGQVVFDGGQAYAVADHSHRITAESLQRGETEESDGHVHALARIGRGLASLTADEIRAIVREELDRAPEAPVADDVVVLALGDEPASADPDLIAFDLDDVRAALATVWQEHITTEVRSAVNALRGRVD